MVETEEQAFGLFLGVGFQISAMFFVCIHVPLHRILPWMLLDLLLPGVLYCSLLVVTGWMNVYHESKTRTKTIVFSGLLSGGITIVVLSFLSLVLENGW